MYDVNVVHHWCLSIFKDPREYRFINIVAVFGRYSKEEKIPLQEMHQRNFTYLIKYALCLFLFFCPLCQVQVCKYC